MYWCYGANVHVAALSALGRIMLGIGNTHLVLCNSDEIFFLAIVCLQPVRSSEALNFSVLKFFNTVSFLIIRYLRCLYVFKDGLIYDSQGFDVQLLLLIV